MTSTIVYSTIDEAFPVAGKDNDSQGFRDNFSIIKTALTTASTEITGLQSGVARVDGANDFNGNVIQEATFQTTYKSLNSTYATGLSASPTTIPFTGGHVYLIQADASITLNFSEFTAVKYCEMRLYLTGDDVARTISFGSLGGGTILTDGNVLFMGDTINVTSSTTPVCIEAVSFNGGSTVMLRYLGTFS